MIACRTMEIQTAAGWKGRKKSSCLLLWNSSLAPSRKQTLFAIASAFESINDIAAHRPDSASFPTDSSAKRSSKFRVQGSRLKWQNALNSSLKI